MKLKHIACAVALFLTGAAGAPAQSGDSVKESSTTELNVRQRLRFKRLTFRCNIARSGTDYRLQARILKNNAQVYVADAGIRLVLADGGEVTLRPERKKGCCDDWAAGRWNNVSFALAESDVRRLRDTDILSVDIRTADGTLSCEVSPSKQGAVGKMIRSLE